MFRIPSIQAFSGTNQIRPILLTVLVFRLGCVLLPFYSLYLGTQRHLDAAIVAAVVGSFGVGGLIADATVPLVLSRLSATATISSALLLQCLSLALTLVLGSPAALFTLTAVWGFCYEIVNPASLTLIIDRVGPEQQRMAFSALRFAINVGMGLGPVLGALLYSLFPPLLFAFNISLLAIAVVTLRLQTTGDASVAREAQQKRRHSWWGGARAEYRFWSFSLAAFPVQLAYALPSTVLSLYLVRTAHLPPFYVGVVLFLNAALVVVFELPLNSLTLHWSSLRAISTGVVFAAVGFAAMGISANLWALVAATIVWTIGEMVLSPAWLVHVREISSAEMTARNMGIFSAGNNIGLALAPTLYDLTRGSMWFVIGVILAAAACFFSVKARHGSNPVTGAPQTALKEE